MTSGGKKDEQGDNLDYEEIRKALTPSLDRPFRNPFGEVVWLRKIKGGLTDCCPVSNPCVVHAVRLMETLN